MSVPGNRHNDSGEGIDEPDEVAERRRRPGRHISLKTSTTYVDGKAVSSSRDVPVACRLSPVACLGALPFRKLLCRSFNADIRKKGGPHARTEVDEGDVPPVDGVPPCKVPGQIHVESQSLDAVQMPQVGQQQDKQHGLPDADVRGGAQNQRLVEGEEKVQIGELGEDDGGAGRDGGQDGGGGGVGQEQVVALAEVGVVCADEGGDRLDGEEEEAVRQRDADADLLLLLLLWRHGGLLEERTGCVCSGQWLSDARWVMVQDCVFWFHDGEAMEGPDPCTRMACWSGLCSALRLPWWSVHAVLPEPGPAGRVEQCAPFRAGAGWTAEGEWH